MYRSSALIFWLAAGMIAVQAQTAAKPASTTHSATTSHTTTHAATSAVKLPPGVPPAKGSVLTAFSLRYQDIKIGAGPLSEPKKVYRVRYTGWIASDGRKFDASDDHPAEPVFGKDLKPVMGEDGKPKKEAGQPILFLQGRPGMIPGWDLGFEGMHVGGKRRLFIPYQMAYGVTGRPSNDPSHPGIPAKADLIFDIELVDMIDLPQAQPQPGMGMRPAPSPGGTAHPATPAPGSSSGSSSGSSQTPPQPPPAPQSTPQSAPSGQSQPK